MNPFLQANLPLRHIEVAALFLSVLIDLIPFDATGRVTTTGISLSLPQETTGRRLQKTVWLLTKLLVILQ